MSLNEIKADREAVVSAINGDSRFLSRIKRLVFQIYVLDESKTAKNTKYFEPVLNSYGNL